MPAKVDHAARRKSLLAASFHTFARDGYSACTMRGLATALGVSTGTLYHYFDSKDAVFVAMFRQLNAEIIASAEAELGDETRPDARLTVLMGFVGRHATKLQAVLRIALEYHRHHDDPEARAWLSDIFRQYTHTFQLHLDLDDPGPARVTLSLLVGALVHQLLDPEAVDLAAHMDWIQRALPVSSTT